MLGGRPSDNAPESEWPDLVSLGVSFELLLRGTGRLAFYALAGAGGYWRQLAGRGSSPSSTVSPGFDGGFGLQGNLGTLQPFAEVRWVIFTTDYGAGDFEPLRYRQLRLGVRIEPQNGGRKGSGDA